MQFDVLSQMDEYRHLQQPYYSFHHLHLPADVERYFGIEQDIEQNTWLTFWQVKCDLLKMAHDSRLEKKNIDIKQE